MKIPNGMAAICAPYPAPTGLTVYLHYEPVGINNWSVVLGVSEDDRRWWARARRGADAIVVTAIRLGACTF